MSRRRRRIERARPAPPSPQTPANIEYTDHDLRGDDPATEAERAQWRMTWGVR